jgi:hypothetical protein
LATDPIAGHDSLHRRHAFIDDPWIFHVERDPEPIDVPSMLGDRSVTEVETEQIDVLPRQRVKSMLVARASAAPSSGSVHGV